MTLWHQEHIKRLDESVDLREQIQNDLQYRIVQFAKIRGGVNHSASQTWMQCLAQTTCLIFSTITNEMINEAITTHPFPNWNGNKPVVHFVNDK